jgi:hypothetical protein
MNVRKLFFKAWMFENVDSLLISGLVKTVQMKLSNETGDFFEFEMLRQNGDFKLFSIFNLYSCSIFSPFYALMVFLFLKSSKGCTLSSYASLRINFETFLGFLGIGIVGCFRNFIRNFIIENPALSFI